jgi:hypothetical protein
MIRLSIEMLIPRGFAGRKVITGLMQRQRVPIIDALVMPT